MINLPTVKQITLSGKDVATITDPDGRVWWKKPPPDPPTVTITSFSGLMYGTSQTVEWSIENVPAGYTAYTIGMWYYYAEASEVAPDYTENVIWENEKRTDTSYTHTIDSLETNNVIYYKIAVALYKSADDAVEDYVAYTELESPEYVCSGDDAYTLAPYNTRCTVTDGVATIEWNLLSAAIYTAGISIQYSYNERNVWYDIATLTDTSVTSYQYDISGQTWTSVAFRVRTYSTRSKYETSNYDYSEWISLA